MSTSRTIYDTGTGTVLVKDRLEVTGETDLAFTEIDTLTVSGVFTTDNITGDEISVPGNISVEGSITAASIQASAVDQAVVTDGDANINGDLTVTGDGLFTGSLTVENDLFVQGNTITVDIEETITTDAFIVLQANATYGEVVAANSDIGLKLFYAHQPSGNLKLAFVGWDRSTNSFTIRDNIPEDASSNINVAGELADIRLGTVQQGVWSGTAIAVTRGGTGVTSVPENALVYGAGTAALNNTGTGSYDANANVGQLLRITSSGAPGWSNSIDGGNIDVIYSSL